MIVLYIFAQEQFIAGLAGGSKIGGLASLARTTQSEDHQYRDHQVPLMGRSLGLRYGVAMPKQDLVQSVLTISTDEGISGYYFGGGIHGDQDALDPVNQNWI